MGNKTSTDTPPPPNPTSQQPITTPPTNIFQLVQYIQTINRLLSDRLHARTRREPAIQFELYHAAHWIEQFPSKSGYFWGALQDRINVLLRRRRDGLEGVGMQENVNELDGTDVSQDDRMPRQFGTNSDTGTPKRIEINVYVGEQLFARIPLHVFYEIYRRVAFEASLHGAVLGGDKDTPNSPYNADWLLVERDLSCTNLVMLENGELTDAPGECETPTADDSNKFAKDESTSNADDDDDECFICMERKVDITLPCTHRFCSECLELWGNTQRNCPLCRCKLEHNEEFQMPEYPSREEICGKLREFIERQVGEYRVR